MPQVTVLSGGCCEADAGCGSSTPTRATAAPGLATPDLGSNARVAGEGDYVAGELIVKMKRGVTSSAADEVMKKHGGKKKQSSRSAGVYTVGIGARDPKATSAELERRILVSTTREPNYPVSACGIDHAERPLYNPTQMWGLHKMRAADAWDITTGTAGVVVAVSDTGLDFTHQDIDDNVWANPGETGLDGVGNDKRTNGLDDDGNGYIDDWRGWDFRNGDNNPTDDHGHGTHVAGTIAAEGNNGTGIVGVSWNSKIMPIKFLGSGGSGTMANGAASIVYAARTAEQRSTERRSRTMGQA